MMIINNFTHPCASELMIGMDMMEGKRIILDYLIMTCMYHCAALYKCDVYYNFKDNIIYNNKLLTHILYYEYHQYSY